MFIEPRKPVTVDELLRGMIVQSGNDATIALAELVARLGGGFRADDEPRGASGSGMKNTQLHQRERLARRQALLDRARPRGARRAR